MTGTEKFCLAAIIFCVLALCVVVPIGCNAMKTVSKEFMPSEALRKYEWFIDQDASIAKMDAEIDLYDEKVKDIEDQYKGYGDDMSEWPVDVRVSYNFSVQSARTDKLSVTSMRNELVREYNAASSKFNWSLFESRADMPRRMIDEL